MNGRIEISLDEYNFKNEQLKKLEDENVKKENELKEYKEMVEDLKEAIVYLTKETTVFERLFYWSAISSTINAELNKL